MTVKEYARSRGVSYEAVRRQVANARGKDLKNHVQSGKGNSGTYLDDFAVSYLDSHRQPRNVIVQAADEETQKELDRLHQQVNELQKELLKRTDKITALMEEMNGLLKEQSQLIEQKAVAELKAAETQELKMELECFKPSWFGLYRKTKRTGLEDTATE